MLHSTLSTTLQSGDDREAAIQQTLTALRATAEPQLCRMAETLVAAPTIVSSATSNCPRAHAAAAAAHQTGLEGRKKTGTYTEVLLKTGV